MSIFSKPALKSLSRYSNSSSAPATQPTQSSTLLRMSAGTSPRTTTSEIASRPPGFKTRNASRSTRSLSPERLMTQLEIITSTEFSGSGIFSMAPFKFHIVNAGFFLICARERKHFVGHIEPVRFSSCTDALRGKQHVYAAAGPEIENSFAGLQFRERRRIAAAERRGDGFLRKRGNLRTIVKIFRDWIAATQFPAAASCDSARSDLFCSRAVFLFHNFLKIFVAHIFLTLKFAQSLPARQRCCACSIPHTRIRALHATHPCS